MLDKKQVMKIKLLTILFSSIFISSYAQTYSIDEVFSKNFQTSFISRGNNLPDFKIAKDSMNLLLVCLHNGISIAEFQSKVNFDDPKMQNIILLLKSKNWLHEFNNEIKPSVFIACKHDGEMLYKYAKPISSAIAERIEQKLPEIKKQFSRTEISKKQSFEEWSFLVLSDVLLDNWQIFSVENEFLGASARPNRHGKNYYASIIELTSDREGFNIYGNQFGNISVYGNNRRKADLTETKYYVSIADEEIFSQIAESFLPDLVQILNENKKYSEKIYRELGYSKEITFEEFYMWWYHFIYTETTDIMNENQILTIPKDGNFVYEIEMD